MDTHSLPTPVDGVSLRAATNKDIQPVTELVFSVLGEYALAPDHQVTDADLKDIEGSYFDGGGAFYVLEDQEETIIATCGIYPLDSQRCELRKMYLLKTYRGRGLGRFLMDHALGEARRLGFKRMILETASVLKEAVALYESYGFQIFQPEHLSARCDQAYVLNL
jgi:putative acetyltransferase